jgi:hypothetical protein
VTRPKQGVWHQRGAGSDGPRAKGINWQPLAFEVPYENENEIVHLRVNTGGTGRFTTAQGSFTVELFHKLEASGVAGGVETHDIFGSFHGTITSPSAAR